MEGLATWMYRYHDYDQCTCNAMPAALQLMSSDTFDTKYIRIPEERITVCTLRWTRSDWISTHPLTKRKGSADYPSFTYEDKKHETAATGTYVQTQ